MIYKQRVRAITCNCGIDHQANLFALIVVGLLSVWVLREFMESFLKSRREEIIQIGMKYIFSLDDNSRTRIHRLIRGKGHQDLRRAPLTLPRR